VLAGVPDGASCASVVLGKGKGLWQDYRMTGLPVPWWTAAPAATALILSSC